jgi:DNA modification methylase
MVSLGQPFYTFKGDVVLDPFIGSGSTALAALQCDRYFVGYDIKSEYVENANKRIRLAVEQPKLWDNRN